MNEVVNQPKKKYSRHEVETAAGQKHFIESRLKHKSTRVGDIPKLADCLYKLNNGVTLDETQKAFLKTLYEEVQARGRIYNAAKRKREAAKKELEKLRQQQNREENASEV